MAFKIVLTPRANKDIDNALVYYQENAGLSTARNFVNEIEHAFSSLKEKPFYQVKNGNYRCFPLRKFPFLLFFEIVEELETIKVLAVFHTSRSPINWP